MLIFLSFFGNKEIKAKNKIDNQIIKIHVNGLVCDFCARSIEKIFSKKKAVASINVSLEKMLITVSFKNGKNLSDDIIKQLILDSGYEVTEISRVN